MEFNKMERQDYIKQLLDKYFEGLTTLAEENELKVYFSENTDIPEDLDYAKAMFGFFTEASAQTGFAQKTTISIENHEAKINDPKKNKISKLIQYSISSAAVLAILTVLTFAYLKNSNRINHETVYCYVNGVPVTDINIAMQYTISAMDVLSESLAKPVEMLQPLNEFNRSLYKLDYIRNMGDILFN